jgi:hypothetical protein
MMNPQGTSQFSDPEGPAVAQDGRLPFNVWIDQLQWMGQFHEFEGTRDVASDPVQDWEDACPPYPSMPATREDLREIGRGLLELAKRIQALEQR